MNINDPFGRMSARHERDYQSLRKALLEAGLTDPEAAAQHLARIRQRGVIGVGIAIPLTLALMLLFPDTRAVSLGLGGLFVLWTLNASRKGQQYLQRYIAEELHQQPPSDSTP
ncbi:MAG TPA: hypothetical protein VIS52_06635 [Motiliproteus sp.]